MHAQPRHLAIVEGSSEDYLQLVHDIVHDIVRPAPLHQDDHVQSLLLSVPSIII